MQLSLIKPDCQISPVDAVDSNPIAYFTVSKERIYFIFFWHTFKWGPHCSAAVRRKPSPHKASAPGDFQGGGHTLKPWSCRKTLSETWFPCLVGVSGPRCQTSYLGFKEHRLISFVFHLIHHAEGFSKVRPWSPFSGSWNSEFTKPGRKHERFIYRISWKGGNLDFGPGLLQIFHLTLIPSNTKALLEAESNMCFEKVSLKWVQKLSLTREYFIIPL